MTPALVEFLVTRAEHEAALARIAALEARQRQTRRWDARARLMVIGKAVEGRVFNAAELRAHAEIHRELARALRPFTSAKRLGKYLRAIAGRPLGGLVLQRIGRDHNGTIWAVQVVGDLHRASGFPSQQGA